MQVLHARAAAGEEERPAKKAKLSVNALSRWDDFASKVDAAKRTVDVSTQGFAFEFVEGALVKALRTGQWLLLDEINMAPPQVRLPESPKLHPHCCARAQFVLSRYSPASSSITAAMCSDASSDFLRSA